jgi:DNA invertase Pin-like site-specific DNA recombinase
MALSVKHFLEVPDELNHLNTGLVSFRENIDTSGPLGRPTIVIIAAISELERSLIAERVRAGMRRARLEGRQIGRARLDINRSKSSVIAVVECHRHSLHASTQSAGRLSGE